MTTTPWSGYASFLMEYPTQAGYTEKILTVYPKDYKKTKKVVEISGDQENFDKIFPTITDFHIDVVGD